MSGLPVTNPSRHPDQEWGGWMGDSRQSLALFCAAFRTFLALNWRALLAPANTLDGWSLEDRNPEVIHQLLPLLDWFYHHYFRVQTDGWENLPNQGRVLMIGSHNGGLIAPDLYMILYDWVHRFGAERPVYALMNPKIWQVLPGLARLLTQVGAVRAHPKLAIAALHRPASLLIYPGGAQDVFRPYAQRHQIQLQGRRGFIKLALAEEVPIIPLISHGAHSTLVVLADIYPQLQQLHQLGFPWPFGIDPEVCPIYLGCPWGIAIGPLPHIPFPVSLHTRVCPPITFERYGPAAAQDTDYVAACYHTVHQKMQLALNQLTAAHGDCC